MIITLIITFTFQLRKAIEDTNSGAKLGHHKTTGFRSAAMESLLHNRQTEDDYEV